MEDVMIVLLIALSLSPMNPQTLPASKPFTTCQMPNKCAKAAAASLQPCVWPNTCAKPSSVLAQYQPCVWPNKCSGRSEIVL